MSDLKNAILNSNDLQDMYGELANLEESKLAAYECGDDNWVAAVRHRIESLVSEIVATENALGVSSWVS